MPSTHDQQLPIGDDRDDVAAGTTRAIGWRRIFLEDVIARRVLWFRALPRRVLLTASVVIMTFTVAAPYASAQVKRVVLPTIDGLEPNGLTWVGGMSADGRYLTV